MCLQRQSISQLNASHYLEIRHIFQLFNFMLGHLVCNEPNDPVEFLVKLLGQCLQYRDALGEPPLLFTKAHIKSLYNAFDPFENASISLDQYVEGMTSLGIGKGGTPYNLSPPLDEEGNVEEEFFLFEA